LAAGVPERRAEAEGGGGGEAERPPRRGTPHPDQHRGQEKRGGDPGRLRRRLGGQGEVEEHPGPERDGEPGREALPLGLDEGVQPPRQRARLRRR
jgi:hypothetical protein